MADLKRTIGRLYDRVLAHHGRLKRAWDSPDPDTTLARTGDGTGRTDSSHGDPTGRAIAAACTTRLELLRSVARNTHDVGDLLDVLGGHTQDTHRHIDLIVAHAEAALEDVDQPRPDSMSELAAISKGWWLALHDHIVTLADTPSGWDTAAWAVDLLTERTEHRLEHQLGRIASRAETAIIRPDHPAAGQDRAACSDRHGYGCNNFLPVGQRTGTCRSCESRAYRQRKAQVENAGRR